MATTIDTLQIEIQSSSTNAASGIKDLSKALSELKTNGTVSVAIRNLNSLSDALRKFTDASNATRSVGKLVGAMRQLKEIGSISRVGNSLTKLSASLKALDTVNVDNVAPQIQRIAEAVAPLSAVKAGGLGTMVNALSKISKVTAELDDEKISAFADRIQKLNTVLEPLSTKMTTIQTGLKGINSSARSAGSSVREMGDDLNASSINMASFIYTIQSAVQWLQAAVDKFSQFIGQAIEWDGIAARFGRGFGDQAQETYEWIQRLNEEMGINVQQFMQYSSIYATMLTGFGVAVEDATKMALGYTELTYDIWAGYNDVYKTFEEASEAVKSAIAGEVEPIRRAGFTIVESTLQQTAANHGLDISLEKATESQKSYLRYLTLVDQAHAQSLVGTYAKELNTAEGLMRTFSQQTKSLAQAFGSLFLPVLVRVMPYLQAFVDLLTDAVRWIASLFGIEIQGVDWSGYNAGVGDAVENTENLGGALGDAASAAKELKNATIGIDELNVISPNSGSGGSGGSGSGSGAGNGFDDLDIDSLWDESIFAEIGNQVDSIKAKLESWLPVIGTIAAALGGLAVTSLIASMGEALAEMNGLQKALASVAILTIEAALVFVFADNYLESGNLMNLVGEALVTAGGGYLMFKAWGVGGAALALGVSILAQLVAIETSLADGTVSLDSPELWIQSAFTVLTGALGGLVLSKYTGFFAKEGFVIGLAVSASLVLATLRMGAIESGQIDSGSVEAWILEIGSLITAGLAGKFLGTAFYGARGGPAGAMIGVTAGLVLNLVTTISVEGGDFGSSISDWINVGLTTAMTGLTAAKLWQIIGPAVTNAFTGLVPKIGAALTTALGGVAAALGVSVGWAVAIVSAIAAAIAGAIYVATHWEEVKNFFLVTIPEWFEGAGATLSAFFTETIPEWFSGAWESIQTFFTDTVPNFFTQTVPGWFDTIGYWIGYGAGTVAKIVVDWWNQDAVPFFTKTIPDFFTETVPEFFTDAWAGIKKFFTVTVPDFFKGVWADAKYFVTTTVPEFFTKKIPEWFSDGWAWVKNFFQVTVPDFFKGVWSDIKEIGKNLVEGLWEGIKGAWDWLVDLCTGFVDGVIQGFKDAFGIASPSTIFADLGGWLIEGLWNGINDKVDWIIDKIGGWVDKVVDKVKDFFGIASPSKEFKEIGGFLIDGLVEGMTDVTALVEPLKEMWQTAKEWWTGNSFDMSFTPDIGNIQEKLSSAWSTARTWWEQKKEKLSTYTPSIGSVYDKVYSAWKTARDWWNKKKGSMNSYTPSIGSIYDTVYARWKNARDWWNKKKSGMNSYTPSIGSIYDKLYTRWKNARDWWNKKKGGMNSYTPSIGSIQSKLSSAWSSAKKWWNKNAKLSTKLDIKTPKIKVNWETASAFGKSFRYPTSFKLTFAAAGGMFDAGSLIWAGERGAEVVANAGGGKTGVMNVDQMQEAVYEGVYAAVMAANRASSGDGGAPAFNIYLDGRQITATVEKRQRERGASIMGNEVYTYG